MSGRDEHGRFATRRSNALASDELHFKTGKAGWLARLLGKIRAAGVSYDHTVVIPTIIVLTAIKLADTGYVGYWLPNRSPHSDLCLGWRVDRDMFWHERHNECHATWRDSRSD